jgi:hypothetical protein
MKRALMVIGWILEAVVVVLMVLSMLDHFDAFAGSDAFYGLDFLPAPWLGILALIPLCFFGLAGKRKLALPLLIIACTYTLTFGDFSLTFLFPPNAPSAGSAKKITVAALNVQYYTHGVREVMDGILSLDAG